MVPDNFEVSNGLIVNCIVYVLFETLNTNIATQGAFSIRQMITYLFRLNNKEHGNGNRNFREQFAADP